MMAVSPANMLAVGVVRGTHGLDGRIRVESLSGETEHLSRMSAVTIVRNGESKVRVIESFAGSGAFVIMKLSGVDSLDGAKDLVKAELWAPRESAAPLGRGEYYYSDLCQCSIIVNDREVGRVIGVTEAPGRDLIEVQLQDGRVALVPFQDEFIGEVNLDEKTVELKTAWILE